MIRPQATSSAAGVLAAGAAVAAGTAAALGVTCCSLTGWPWMIGVLAAGVGLLGWLAGWLFVPSAPGLAPDLQARCVGCRETLDSAAADVERITRAERRAAEASDQLADRAAQLERTRLALLNIVHDLSAKEANLQEARAQLAKLNRSLEATVAERTEEVSRLLELKDAFIRRLGHDLKTPLTPITALLPMVLQQIDEPACRQKLELMLANARYMRDLVENTLTLASINAGSLELQVERVEMGALVADVLGSLDSELAAANVRAVSNVPAGLTVRADRLHVRGVLENLLSNAMKYMGGPGQVRVTAWAEGAWGWVAVSDTGMGLTPEHLSRVFDEFFKADESRHDRSSTGLGLSICRQVVSRHGGLIDASSPGPGKGATFRFSLPLATEAVAAVPVDADASGQGASDSRLARTH